MKTLTIALVGNPNCGKTTLFNALTGSRQRVGNFPGVTVEKKEGELRHSARRAEIVDLPGAYSLEPYSAEEAITRDYLIQQRPDAVIDVVDALNPERNLYLTSQLLELGIPVVVAFNMIDEARAAGAKVDVKGISRALGVEVTATAASAGEGVHELAESALRAAQSAKPPAQLKFGGSIEGALGALEAAVHNEAALEGVPPRRFASRMLESAADERLALTPLNKSENVEAVIRAFEAEAGCDGCAAIIQARYQVIEDICVKNIRMGKGSPSQKKTAKIDAVVTNGFLALPVLAAALGGVFWLTFGATGRFLSQGAARIIDAFSFAVNELLLAARASETVRSLVTDGALAGVGGVLSFLPTVLLLFALLSLLEDCGYMARAAYITDRPLRAVGLTGRSAAPLLAGFGCTVPAVLATRTLPTERSRRLTTLAAPFMSCSAKLPVYTLISGALFARRASLVVALLYVFGAAVGVGYCLVYKKALSGERAPFMIELPCYRFPTMRGVLRSLRQRAGDFVKKTFSVIFIASLAVWFLQRFDFALRPVGDVSQSALAQAGRLAALLFEPLGFGDWRIATALLAGLTAKEAAAGTLAVLFSQRGIPLAQALAEALTPVSACSLLVFILLYMPCAAAAAAMKKELGGAASATLAMLCQTALAWLAAFAVYRLGLLLV